jgi:hypothetical protein
MLLSGWRPYALAAADFGDGERCAAGGGPGAGAGAGGYFLCALGCCTWALGGELRAFHSAGRHPGDIWAGAVARSGQSVAVRVAALV